MFDVVVITFSELQYYLNEAVNTVKYCAFKSTLIKS